MGIYFAAMRKERGMNGSNLMPIFFGAHVVRIGEREQMDFAVSEFQNDRMFERKWEEKSGGHIFSGTR